MKNLLRNSFVLMSIALLYSCAPKYTAHFNHKSNESSKHELITENIYHANDEVLGEVNPSELVASNSETLVLLKENPIKKIVEAHEIRIQQINSSGIEGKLLKKELKRENKKVKKEIIKEVKEAKKANDDYTLMMILAFFIPFLGVGLTYGITQEFWISLVLTLLFWLPAAIYALIKVHEHFRG
jgi:uncharacterized membrane protein YqaE (UPF0057 family)